MATYYAWSNIKTGKDGKPFAAKVGDKVDASTLGLDEEQFQELIDAGSVREQKYPVPADSDVSPKDHQRALMLASQDSDEYAESIAAAEAEEASEVSKQGK